MSSEALPPHSRGRRGLPSERDPAWARAPTGDRNDRTGVEHRDEIQVESEEDCGAWSRPDPRDLRIPLFRAKLDEIEVRLRLRVEVGGETVPRITPVVQIFDAA